MCYYIILSASTLSLAPSACSDRVSDGQRALYLSHRLFVVIVSRMDSEHSVSRTVCFLNRGDSFGELGLISNAPRQASVISKEPVELLVFSDEVSVTSCPSVGRERTYQ